MADVLFALWWIFVALNFLIQLLFFFRDQSFGLFLAKKVSTPLLLFWSAGVVWYSGGQNNLFPVGILLLMGLGELGIEGSKVVQGPESVGTALGRWENLRVTVAGLLFLLVNVLLGGYLLLDSLDALAPIAVMVAAIGALVGVGLPLGLTLRFGRPTRDVRGQMIVYSLGLFLLALGSFVNWSTGLTSLGLAGLILTVSDTLVLVRMGAGFDKSSARGFGVLLGFLVVILLLYYSYMYVLKLPPITA